MEEAFDSNHPSILILIKAEITRRIEYEHDVTSGSHISSVSLSFFTHPINQMIFFFFFFFF